MPYTQQAVDHFELRVQIQFIFLPFTGTLFLQTPSSRLTGSISNLVSKVLHKKLNAILQVLVEWGCHGKADN